MRDSKLIETLKILTSDEINQVRNLLCSDWIIKGIPQKEALQLFNYILKYQEDWDSEQLSKELALHAIYGKKQTNTSKIIKNMTNLMAVIEYLIGSNIRNTALQPLGSNLNLAEFYILRGLAPRSEIFLKRAEEFFETKKELSIKKEEFFSKFLEEILTTIDSSKKVTISLENVIKQHKIIALLRNLELITKLVYPKIIFDKSSENIFDDIILYLEQYPELKENVLIRLYSLSLLMAKNLYSNENIYYQEYKKLLREVEDSLAEETAKALFSMERSYLVKVYNINPNDTYSNLLFTMYKEQLKKGYLLIEGIFPKGIALNIMTIAIKNNDSECLLELLTVWKNQIGTPSEREEILSFCWANFYFLTKDFQKANDYIKISYLDLDFIINTRRMKIKILFEQNETVALTYEIESFKVFIFRQFKKEILSENKYVLNNNFIDNLKHIVNLSHQRNDAKKIKLLEKVESQKCTDKEWLLSKII
jgi:hypothetical protein